MTPKSLSSRPDFARGPGAPDSPGDGDGVNDPPAAHAHVGFEICETHGPPSPAHRRGDQ